MGDPIQLVVVAACLIGIVLLIASSSAMEGRKK